MILLFRDDIATSGIPVPISMVTLECTTEDLTDIHVLAVDLVGVGHVSVVVHVAAPVGGQKRVLRDRLVIYYPFYAGRPVGTACQ